jgi:hypothetical protein
MAEPIPFPEVPRQINTRNSFLDLIFGTLFQPLKTFRHASGPNSSRGVMISAIYSVALVSMTTAVVQLIANNDSPAQLSYLIPLKIIFGLLCWLWSGLVVGLTAQAFTGKMQLNTFLRLSGLAVLPGIFLAPVMLVAQGANLSDWSSFAVLIYNLPALLIWIWSSLLFTLALVVTYQMDGERVFLFLLAPVMVVMSFFIGAFVLLINFMEMSWK